MTAPPAGFVAPAVLPLTELHIPAELAAACLDPQTVCGLPMPPGELWQPVDRRPGDRVCPACTGHPAQAPALW